MKDKINDWMAICAEKPSDVCGKYEVMLKDGSIKNTELGVGFEAGFKRWFIGVEWKDIIAWRMIGRTR